MNLISVTNIYVIIYIHTLQITRSIIEEIDSKALNIEPTLSYITPNHSRIKYESAKFKWIKQNRESIRHEDEITIFHHTTTSDDLTFEIPRKKSNLLTELVQECIKLEDGTETVPATETLLETKNIILNEEVNNSYDTTFDNCDEVTDIDNNEVICKEDREADGMNLDEEYATIVPISIVEAKAVVDVYKMFAHGKFQCEKCGKAYYNENRLSAHMRMHDTVITIFIFKIDNLLSIHVMLLLQIKFNTYLYYAKHNI